MPRACANSIVPTVDSVGDRLSNYRTFSTGGTMKVQLCEVVPEHERRNHGCRSTGDGGAGGKSRTELLDRLDHAIAAHAAAIRVFYERSNATVVRRHVNPSAR